MDENTPPANPHDFLVFEQRPSDSPFVHTVWRSHSERAGTFTSVAASHCGIVFSRCAGKVRVTLRGPETRATAADCPADGEWFGITLAVGAFFPAYPAERLRDRNDVDLPEVTSRTFWMLGEAWPYPDFENAETFVARLIQAGLIRRDPSVAAALRGELKDVSQRTTQRHFLQATGVTYGTYRQIERARHALELLRQGASVLDATHHAGYFDQAHLTRSLRSFAGDTPARVRQRRRQLSLLYKTPYTR